MVAGTQKVVFLCKCCSTTLVPSLNDQSCCSDTTGRAKKAEWRQNHCHGGSSVAMVTEWRHSVRHSDRSMDAIGRQRRHNGGTRKADVSLKLIHNVRNFYWATDGRPLCIHSATTVMCVPSACHLWATDLVGDLYATVLNMLKTLRRPWRPWRCLNVLCATLERPRQPFGLPSAFNGDLASFVVAQGRHKGRSPCVKGVLIVRICISTHLSLVQADHDISEVNFKSITMNKKFHVYQMLWLMMIWLVWNNLVPLSISIMKWFFDVKLHCQVHKYSMIYNTKLSINFNCSIRPTVLNITIPCTWCESKASIISIRCKSIVKFDMNGYGNIEFAVEFWITCSVYLDLCHTKHFHKYQSNRR